MTEKECILCHMKNDTEDIETPQLCDTCKLEIYHEVAMKNVVREARTPVSSKPKNDLNYYMNFYDNIIKLHNTGDMDRIYEFISGWRAGDEEACCTKGATLLVKKSFQEGEVDPTENWIGEPTLCVDCGRYIIDPSEHKSCKNISEDIEEALSDGEVREPVASKQKNLEKGVNHQIGVYSTAEDILKFTGAGPEEGEVEGKECIWENDILPSD